MSWKWLSYFDDKVVWLDDHILWGGPMIVLLVGTGLYLTLILKGLQFVRMPLAMRLIFHKDEAEGDISHFAALMTALAATVGNGNIVGVASAIVIGGPGAVFWMWVTGLVGMATKYSEAILAVKYREVGRYGMRGGPMYYISKGAGLPWLGWMFSFFAVCAGFAMGNMFQAQSVAGNIASTFDFVSPERAAAVSKLLSGFGMQGSFSANEVEQLVVGLVMMVLTGLVILGGIKSIGRISSFLVPFMILAYCGASILIICLNWRSIPHAFGLIFHYAFTPYAAVGGTAGALIARTVGGGMARGVFSNESGLGSSPIAAAATKTDQPATQALVSMTQTFIDTIIVCTMTALTILTAQSYFQGVSDKNTLTAVSFAEHLGRSGAIVVSMASALFAYSTILGWCYYGERSIEYILGARAVVPYRIFYTLAVLVATFPRITLDIIIHVSDAMNAMMAIPNLIGLILLAWVVRRETDAYFRARAEKKAQKV